MDADGKPSRRECRVQDFFCLPIMCKNSHFKLGTLTSESFSERMISAENILLDKNLLRVYHASVDNMVVLRINKRLMERARYKYALSLIELQDVLSVNQHISKNEECKH